MNADTEDDPVADMEMSSKEAAAYLSGSTGHTLSTKFVRELRYLDLGPVVEKRGSRLVYRKSALDAFLSENGTDPQVWTQGVWKRVADQLRGVNDAMGGAFGPMIHTLNRLSPEERWDPDQAK